jgi:hypothetical protein
MFIRWVSSKKRSRAILVQSVRINGKPRLRHVATLAGFERAQIDQLFPRSLFWRQAYAVLDLLMKRRRIRSGDRIKAIVLMSSKVGMPPTREENAAVDAGILQALQELRDALRGQAG